MIKYLVGGFIYSIAILSCTTSDGQLPAQSDSTIFQDSIPSGDAAPSNALPGDASDQTEAQIQNTEPPQNKTDGSVIPGADSSGRVPGDQRNNTDAAPRDGGASPDVYNQQPGDAAPATDSSAPLEPCDHACLVRFLDEYYDSLTKNDASTLKVSPDLRVTEDGKDIGLGEGIWKTVTALRAFREDFVDPVQGQAGSFVVLEEGRAATLLTVRLKIVDHQITEIETIVSRTGAHMFFAPNNLVAADPIFDEIVPEPQRSSREDLERLANAYFDAIENGNGSALVFDATCRRLENGVVAASGTSIGRGLAMFSYIEEITRRIPVVDEERGLAFGLAVFNMPSQARSTLIGELFKIIDGRFHMIHAFLLNVPPGTPSGW